MVYIEIIQHYYFLLVICLPLSAPDNGMIDCTGRRSRQNTFGSTCTFSCNHGYELSGSETRTCQSDGTWSGTEAMCILGTTA